jgi:hypothetical protein
MYYSAVIGLILTTIYTVILMIFASRTNYRVKTILKKLKE